MESVYFLVFMSQELRYVLINVGFKRSVAHKHLYGFVIISTTT